MRLKGVIQLVLLVFFFSACQGEDPNQLLIYSLLHDDSSKVWMVESERVNGQEMTEDNPNFKTVLIFYQDNSYAEQSLPSLGKRPPKKGVFEVGSQNHRMTFILNQKENTFVIKHFSKSAIFLVSEDKSTQLKLIPFPKL